MENSLNNQFLESIGDVYKTRTLDYMRVSFINVPLFFKNLSHSMDCDNSSFMYDDLFGVSLVFSKVKTPRGFGLIGYTIMCDKPIPFVFFEIYNKDSRDFLNYSGRLDFYSSFFRYFYISQSLTPYDIVSNIIGPFLNLELQNENLYKITRFDIAVDLKIAYKNPVIQNPDYLFNLRSDTRDNIDIRKFTYYVGSRESKYRFFRVYDKTNDIKRQHKEFLFPELLDGDYTRIEAQYNSGCSFDSFDDFLLEHFPISSTSQEAFFMTYKSKYSGLSLSLTEKMRSVIQYSKDNNYSYKYITHLFEEISDKMYSNL